MSVFSALRYPYRGPAGAQACKIYLHDFTILMMVCAHHLLFLSSTIVVRFQYVFGIPMLYISQGDHIFSRIVPSSPEPKMHTQGLLVPNHHHGLVPLTLGKDSGYPLTSPWSGGLHH